MGWGPGARGLRGHHRLPSPHRVISLPYTSNGLQITPFGQSVRLVAKQLELELEAVWGPDSHLMVRREGPGWAWRPTALGGQVGLWRGCPPWGSQPALRLPCSQALCAKQC